MTAFERALGVAAGVVEPALVRVAHAANHWPPLFIVGAPRSGTTVVFQHIVNTLELGYFPNLAKEHPRACVTMGYLARRRYRYAGSYESAYGVIEGPMAPSDGWGIFHRWFPRYDLDRPVREDRLHELRTIVRAFEKIFAAPLANKNNANSLRVPWLLRVFPDARFVHVRRDVCDTVRSVLKSRAAHGVPDDEWWGVAPPHFYDRRFESELERVVYQTVDVERFVAGSLEGLDDDHARTVPYESFCDAPETLIDWVRRIYAGAGVELGARAATPPASFRRSSAPDAGRAELDARIREIAARVETEAC